MQTRWTLPLFYLWNLNCDFTTCAGVDGFNANVCVIIMKAKHIPKFSQTPQQQPSRGVKNIVRICELSTVEATFNIYSIYISAINIIMVNLLQEFIISCTWNFISTAVLRKLYQTKNLYIQFRYAFAFVYYNFLMAWKEIQEKSNIYC